MLNITLELSTGLAKLTSTTAIKAGAQVPVTIITQQSGANQSPGENPYFQLALGTQGSSPAVKAYLDDFTAENDYTFTGVLDCSDTRLIDYMNGKGVVSMDFELDWTVDDELQIAANFAVSVQPRIISGPTTSEGGPTYLTQGGFAAFYTTFLAALPTSDPHAVGQPWNNGGVIMTSLG